MKIVTARQLEQIKTDSYEDGHVDGQSVPTTVLVAGVHEDARQHAMVRVKSPNGDRGRVHRIAGINHLQGFRGGVLLCAYGTPLEIEDEARRRGITLVDISWDGPA